MIDELVREGLLLRRHGSGTYVAEPKIALPLTMTSFSEDMTRRGMRPGSRVVAFQCLAAGAKLGQRLQISPVDEVWVITRLRLADDETMAIEWLHAPRRLLGDLRREELADHSYYELLKTRRGHHDRLRRPDDRAHGDLARRRRSCSACPCTRPPSCSNGPPRATGGRWWSSSGPCTAGTGTGW